MRKLLRITAAVLAYVLVTVSLCGCEDILTSLIEMLPEDGEVAAAEAVPKIAFGTEELSNESEQIIKTEEEIEAAELISAELISDHHFGQLSESERAVYRALLYALENGYGYIYVDRLIETEPEALERAFVFLAHDSPFVEQNFNYTTGSYTMSYDIGNGKRAALEGVYISIANFTEEHWNKKCEALSKARDVVAKMPQNSSESEKAEYLYEYVLKNVDYLNYGDADVAEEHFLYDGLINRKTHCDGTSNMYSLLLNLVGIENFERSYDGGENEVGHTWNTVKLDGKWYNVDATALLDREDFELRIKRNFATEDKLLSFPSTLEAEYPRCEENLAFRLLSYDTVSKREVAKAARSEIRSRGYAVVYIKNYDDGKMNDAAQELADSLGRTVTWYKSDLVEGAKLILLK